MSRLSVYLPGLRAAAPPAANLPPAFARLLARADWQTSTLSPAQRLLAQLGLDSSLPLPVASLCASHDLGLETPEDGWYRADPVYLRVDPRLILLVAPQVGDIGPDEAAVCLAALNEQLSPHCWRSGRSPDRWYVRGPELGATSPYGPAWLDGRSITPFVSRAPADRAWRTLFNDAQMVLHAVESNEARAAAGEPPLNAVWLWGGGVMEVKQTARVATVGNDLLLAGASRVRDAHWQATLEPAQLATLLETSDVALMVGAPWGKALPDAPVLDQESFARDWAALVWRALAERACEEVLIIGDTAQARLTPGSRWRWWRRCVTQQPGDPYHVDEPAVTER